MKHEYKVKLRYSDVDPMSIVHNSVYQILIEEARIDLVEKENYPYSRMEKEGLIFPISEINLFFKNPIYFGESVSVFTSFEYVKNFSMKFLYKIEKSDGTIACEGYTVHAYVDSKTREFTELPDEVRNIFEKYIEK